VQYPDIYFEPFWGELHARLEKGAFGFFTYESPLGAGVYPFVKREAPVLVDGLPYYDTVTPYGFSGPLILWSPDRLAFACEFDARFQTYCQENRIIAEYVRFSPWLKNHLAFQSCYELKPNRVTLSVDLTGDFFTQEFSSKCRNQVRKAQKSGVCVEFDFRGERLADFIRLYGMMVEKNDISGYYDFPEVFFKAVFAQCAPHAFLAHALYEGQVISSAIFLSYGPYLHYHLAGNAPGYGSLCANHLLLFEVAKWGKAQGKTTLHLGGAFEKGLLAFKQSFTKSEGLPFFVGTRIRNPAVYQAICSMTDARSETYFPAYRG